MATKVSWAGFLAGLVVAGVTAWLVTSETGSLPIRSVRGLRPAVAASSPQRAGSRADSGLLGASAPSLGKPVGEVSDSRVGKPRGVDEIRQELYALRRRPDAPPSEYRELLTDLLHQGTAGRTAVLELLGEEAFDVPWRGRVFLEVLDGVDDERVLPTVVALLERYRAAGWTYRGFRDGYYQLIARHGGRQGAEYLWELVRGDPRDDVARLALAEINGSEIADRVLADLGTDPAFSNPDVAEALAGWNEPRVTARLRQLAMDADATPGLRRGALRGLAERTRDAADARELVGAFRAASTARERSVALSAAYGLAENPHLSEGFRRDLVAPLLAEALGDADGSVRGAAMSAINDYPTYRTPQVEIALAALEGTGLEDAESVALLLGKVRATPR